MDEHEEGLQSLSNIIGQTMNDIPAFRAFLVGGSLGVFCAVKSAVASSLMDGVVRFFPPCHLIR